MINRKLILASTVIGLAGLCTIGCILLFDWFHENKEMQLATIEFPSGDRIIIKYYSDYFLSAIAQTTGGLRYYIYSGESHSLGQLTEATYYDCPSDVKLTHEILGEKRMKIEDGCHYLRSWIFEGDSSGQYKVTELPRQKRN